MSETATLENPVLKADDDAAMEAALLAGAEASDKGQEIEVELPDSGTTPEAAPGEDNAPAKDSPSGDDPDATSSETPPDDRPRDEHGRFIEKKPEPTAPETQGETKPETNYDKAKKEKERFERNWQKLQADRQVLEQQRAEFQQQLIQQQSQPQQNNGQQSIEEFSAKALRKAALDWMDEGEVDIARKALQQEEVAAQREEAAYYQQAVEEFKEQWRGYMAQAVHQEPALANPNTPLSQEVQQLMTDHAGLFERIPQGFGYAVQVAKLRLDAGRVSELEAKNKELKAQVDALNGKLRIGGSSPTSPTSSKRFEDMSLEEQERYLERASDIPFEPATIGGNRN